MKKYNEAIMQAVRQRFGLDENDVSIDESIMKMKKEEVFEEYCKWHGLLGTWYYDLLGVVEDIFDMDLLEK